MLAVTLEPQSCGHQDRPGHNFATSIYKKNLTASLWLTGENYTPSAVQSPPLKVASPLQTATRSRSRASAFIQQQQQQEAASPAQDTPPHVTAAVQWGGSLTGAPTSGASGISGAFGFPESQTGGTRHPSMAGRSLWSTFQSDTFGKRGSPTDRTRRSHL